MAACCPRVRGAGASPLGHRGGRPAGWSASLQGGAGRRVRGQAWGWLRSRGGQTIALVNGGGRHVVQSLCGPAHSSCPVSLTGSPRHALQLTQAGRQQRWQPWRRRSRPRPTLPASLPTNWASSRPCAPSTLRPQVMQRAAQGLPRPTNLPPLPLPPSAAACSRRQRRRRAAAGHHPHRRAARSRARPKVPGVHGVPGVWHSR